MATTYNDIIRKRGGKAAYSIEEEKEKQWESFIPNEQFNAVLRTVLRSVRGNDIDNHKSFWINGTYGTGKSHAVSVIKHLLCDPINKIQKWVDYEYQDDKFKQYRDSIYSLRDKKRLLPVNIEGLRDMSHASDLPLVLQTAVVKSLKDVNIEFAAVDTDFDALIKHINDNPVIWDDWIVRFSELSSIAPNREILTKKLLAKDMATYQKAKTVSRKANTFILMDHDNIGEWLIEVQEKLRETSDYKGLLIIWDEFTDVMDDSIGISVLKALQTIAHKFANEENDSFLFLISHPSAFNKLGVEETKQTDGRYHRMKYNMAPVSAFKIMSRKFEITDPARHESMRNYFYTANNHLLDLYTQTSNDPAETRKDLQELFPLHPATANLATHYATVVGSSSRSVFEFIGQNDQMANFLADEQAFANRLTVTADYLWDFVLKVFQDDVQNYGAVTERFNNYRQHVENHGEAAYAIFKGILLLNAFNNMSGENNNDLVTPTEDNIIHLFTGTQYETELTEVLKWFNEDGIIQRTPGGVYSVQFSALPSQEIEEIKESLRNDSKQYRFTSSVLNFGDTAKSYFEKKYVQKMIRPYSYGFFSEASNDSILKDQIKRAKKDANPSDLFMALFFGKNQTEVAHLRELAMEASSASNEDKDLRDIVFIVFDCPFGNKEYDRFIEYMANYSVAQSHGFLDQVNVHRDHAAEMIKEWLQSAQRNNAQVFVNGQTLAIAVKHLTSQMNNIIAPLIFGKGPDAIEILRQKAPNPFWKVQVSKEMARTFMFATTKVEIASLANPKNNLQYLIQECLNENLEWRDDVNPEHPFKAVFDFIQNRIKYADKSTLFNFIEKFDDLRKPPYGLSANFASIAMVTFALRGWANKIFDTVGKPIDQNSLVDAVGELFSVWDKGKISNKLSFKFQTPEEGKLCKTLAKTLKLDKLKGYNDVSSLTDARFAITRVLLEEKGYPLWSLKYMDANFVSSHPAITLNDELRKLFDNIVDICNERDKKNPALVKETLELLEKYRADIPDIFAKPGSFANGFNNFLLSQQDIELKLFEIESAYDYIKKHLESTIGYWTEEEVARALMSWRIALNKEIEEQRRIEEEEERKRQEDELRKQEAEERARLEQEAKEAKDKAKQELKGKPEIVAKKKVSAREFIDGINSPEELRSILDKVIELDYEFVIDEILNSAPLNK